MATAEPKPHTCRLTLTIDGTEYTVRPLTVAWYGRRAFRLRKADGTRSRKAPTASTSGPRERSASCNPGNFAKP
jgi:hypothetical protein